MFVDRLKYFNCLEISPIFFFFFFYVNHESWNFNYYSSYYSNYLDDLSLSFFCFKVVTCTFFLNTFKHSLYTWNELPKIISYVFFFSWILLFSVVLYLSKRIFRKNFYVKIKFKCYAMKVKKEKCIVGIVFYLSTQLAAVNTSWIPIKTPEQRIFLSFECKTIACHGISAKIVFESSISDSCRIW